MQARKRGEFCIFAPSFRHSGRKDNRFPTVPLDFPKPIYKRNIPYEKSAD